jgi:hypothetical protein
MKHIWINPNFLDENAGITTWHVGEYFSWKRSYEHLIHAESLLKNVDNEFVRIDIITTLKRTINHRLKLLNKLYHWKSIPFDLPKGELQRLEIIGVVKKQMVTNLFEIRNQVEHQDKYIPNREKCVQFTEFTWYFLKSTDHLIINIPCDIWFTNDKEEELTIVEIDPEKDWKIKILKQKNSKNLKFLESNNWINAIISGQRQIAKLQFLILTPNFKNPDGIKLLNRYFFEQA